MNFDDDPLLELIPVTGDERPKGFVDDYVPRPGSDRARYMDAAEAVIADYAARDLKVSTRAIAYRTAANLGAGHEQLDNIEDAVIMLRRTQRIEMNAVLDGRSQWEKPWVISAQAAARGLLAALEDLRCDRQQGQPWRVVLMVEAAGMLPIIEPIADEYGVVLMSGSGSVPISAVHTLAAEAADVWEVEGIRTVVLCLTDFDLMGLRNIFVPFARDVKAFAENLNAPEKVIVRRIAATPEQIEEHIPEALRQPPPPKIAWWPAQFSLPAAEALIDWIPGIIRRELNRYLPDAALRQQEIQAEKIKRREAARELKKLLK